MQLGVRAPVMSQMKKEQPYRPQLNVLINGRQP